MKKRILNGMLAIAMMFVVAGSFVSCKDYDEDAYAELQGQNVKLETAVADLEENLQRQLDALKALQKECSDSCANWQGAHVAEYKALIDALNGRIDSLNAVLNPEGEVSIVQQITNLTTEVNNINTTIENFSTVINNKVNTNAENIEKNAEAIKKNIDDVKYITDSLIPEAVAKANQAYIYAQDNEARIKALEDGKADKSKVEEIEKTLQDAKKACEEADSILNVRIKLLEDSAAKLDDLKALKDACEAADKKLADDLNALDKKVDELQEQVNKNTADLKKIFDAFKLAVSGVIIQGTYNPVFGSFAYPANIQSNVLMAYYGEAGSYGVEFPSYYPRYYANGNAVLTPADIDMLGVTAYKANDGAVIIGEEGNAGKIYLTVNPTNVNFEGKLMPIVNSLDEESAVKLSPLAYSDYKLQFGYSRSAQNGFYEANATLNAEDVENVAMKFDFNTSDIKATVKDILTPNNGVNVTNAVNTVADVLAQFNQKLDANAVKATWNDEVAGERSVYSNYNLATTAVKPLSYAFMQGVNVSSVPGISRAEELINKVADRIKINLPDFNITITAPVIEKVELGELTEDLMAKFKVVVQLDTTITVADKVINVTATDAAGNPIEIDPIVVQGEQIKFLVTREVDMTQAVKDLYAEMNKPVDGFNDIVDNLNKFMDDVNNLLDEINKVNDYISKFENALDRTKNKLITYLDKLNKKVCNLVNSANKALQPVLLVHSNGSYARLSQAINYPSRINGTQFTLVPTSYTAEIIAPAFKKLVGVTNVYSLDRTKNAQAGDAKCKAALQRANGAENVAEILNGDVQNVNFTAEKGYVYEIVYTAVDYSGKNVAKKYYVTAE